MDYRDYYQEDYVPEDDHYLDDEEEEAASIASKMVLNMMNSWPGYFNIENFKDTIELSEYCFEKQFEVIAEYFEKHKWVEVKKVDYDKFTIQGLFMGDKYDNYNIPFDLSFERKYEDLEDLIDFDELEDLEDCQEPSELYGFLTQDAEEKQDNKFFYEITLDNSELCRNFIKDFVKKYDDYDDDKEAESYINITDYSENGYMFIEGESIIYGRFGFYEWDWKITFIYREI